MLWKQEEISKPKQKQNRNKNSMQIERNGKALEFVDAKIKRGDRKGRVFPIPDYSKVTTSDLVDWLGEDTAKDKLYAFLTLTSQAAVKKFTENDDGEQVKELDQEAFRKALADLSVRGESMADLEEKREELLEQLDTATETMADDPAGTVAKIMKINAEIKTISASIADRRRESEAKSEERKAKKAAEAAKTPQAPVAQAA